ncbi:hypothetical protein HY991_05730, partial [Candidatus Micrarchaeota archaeon]|nr:hypothetical protein [Candidatus Micrarchaeota archaeon]
CSNHTYKLASEETVINFTTKLNTTAYAINLTITYPNGTTANILPNETSTDNANHIYYNIYRISTPDAGTYTLNGTAADTYYQARSSTNRFYVRSSPTTYSLTSEGAANMSLADVCSGATIAVGATSINTDLPAGNYTLFVNTSNQSFSFNEMSSSNGVALNYTPLAAGTMTPPFNRTALVGFNALSSLNYSRAVIFYNYTAVNSSITSEASLEIYRCNNVSNCTWSIVDSTVNTSEKTITAETSSLDGGWVLFQPAKSVIQTVTRTETGTTYVPTEVNVPYKVVENQTVEVEKLISARLIKLPEEVEMYINESKDVPVEIVNPHKVELKGIRIEVDSGNKNLKARLNLTYIASLKPNQSEFISMNLKSVVNVSGVYTVTTKLGVDSPALSDSAKLTVKVAKYLSTDKLEVKKTLDFATELFNENPACLELTELLKKAAAHIEKGEFDEAKLTLARAINGCNKVISARGISPITGMILKEIDWNTTGVIVIISLASAFTVLLYLRLHKPKKGSQGGEAHGS